MKLKLKVGLATLALLLFNVVIVHAQLGGDLPCEGQDVDGNCPLDSWVVVLVILVSIAAVGSLYRRRRSEEL